MTFCFGSSCSSDYSYFFLFLSKLFAFYGNEPDKSPVLLQSRTASIELKTTVDATSKPETLVRPSIDVNITWLLSNIDDTNKPKFSIDRVSKSCHTPRRNQQIEEVLTFLSSFYSWSDSVRVYFTNQVFSSVPEHGLLSWTDQRYQSVRSCIALIRQRRAQVEETLLQEG